HAAAAHDAGSLLHCRPMLNSFFHLHRKDLADILVVINKTEKASEGFRFLRCLGKRKQAKFLELDLSETAIAEPPSFIFQFKNLKVLSFNGRKGPSYKLLPNLPSLFKVIQGRRTNPMAQMLPLLSGLSSLRELKLRDCNLCEGDLPRDIYGLSSLWPLDLSGNNFISILASLTRLSKLGNLILSNCNMCTLGEADIHGDISGISSLIRFDLSGKNFITIPLALTQLSRLKLLKLSGCKMLKSLPELPTSIAAVHIDGCS
ncbi:disease resistance-like protein DSC1, partial [Gossypium raimondii]